MFSLLFAIFTSVFLSVFLTMIVFEKVANHNVEESQNDFPKPKKGYICCYILLLRRFVYKQIPLNCIKVPLHRMLWVISHKLYDDRIDMLSMSEKCVYSQNGEDGVLELIFNTIGHGGKTFVEFGVEDGKECNTRYLVEKYQWSGILMDGGHENQKINLKKEFITAENIELLFQKYNIDKEFDFLSIDIDGNDWHVWNKITNYRPRLVCVELNVSLGLQDKVMPYNPNHSWDFGSSYHGASLTSMTKLANAKGYSLIHVSFEGVNAFFIRNDLLDDISTILNMDNVNNCKKLWQRTPCIGRHGGQPYYSEKPFTSSKKLLN